MMGDQRGAARAASAASAATVLGDAGPVPIGNGLVLHPSQR